MPDSGQSQEPESVWTKLVQMLMLRLLVAPSVMGRARTVVGPRKPPQDCSLLGTELQGGGIWQNLATHLSFQTELTEN